MPAVANCVAGKLKIFAEDLIVSLLDQAFHLLRIGVVEQFDVDRALDQRDSRPGG